MCQRESGGVCGAVGAQVGVSEQPREGDLDGRERRQRANRTIKTEQKLKKTNEETRKSELKQIKSDNID